MSDNSGITTIDRITTNAAAADDGTLYLGTSTKYTTLNLSATGITGALNLYDITDLKTLDVSNMSGTKLTSLSVPYEITSLNISGAGLTIGTEKGNFNPAGYPYLTYLNVGNPGENVEEFVLQNHTALQELVVGSDKIILVNVSGCTALETLNLAGCTSLKALSIGGTKITALNDSSEYAANLESLDISGNTAFAVAEAGTTGEIAEGDLDLSSYTNLRELHISGCTQVKAIKLPNAEKLTHLFASGCTGLTVTDATDGKGTLDFSAYTGLVYLNLSNCTQVAKLTLAEGETLKNLDITGTLITEFNVSGLKGILSPKQYSMEDGRFFRHDITTKVTCEPRFYAKQLVLKDGSLTMYFFMELDDASLADFESDEKVNDSMMEFSVGGTKLDLIEFNKNIYLTDYVDTKTGLYDFTKTEINNAPNVNGFESVKHYGFACDVTSIQMADEITASFTYSVSEKNPEGTGLNGDEPAAADVTTYDTTYSVKQYLDDVIKLYANNDLIVNLANALKDYGYYVQTILKQTNKETYCEHEDMDKANETAYTEIWTGQSKSEIERVKDAVASYTITNNTGLDGDVGCALQLDAKIGLAIYLPSSITEDMITLTDENATKEKEGDTLVVYFPNIAVKQLVAQHTITVKVKNSEGTEENKTISACGMTYINSVLNMADADYTQNGTTIPAAQVADLKNAVVALYNYYEADQAYR